MVYFSPEVVSKWPTPNYVDPITRGPGLYIVSSIWLFMATVAIALRLYTRIWIRNWFGLDDAFVVIAWVCALGVSACVMLGYHEFGWDRHVWDIPVTDVNPSGKTLYASKLIWAGASSSVRFSIVCLYYRLLEHIGLQKYRWVLHLNVAFMIIVFCEQIFTVLLACIPIRAEWTWPPVMTAKCLDDGTAMLAGACLNTISEFIVAALPLPVLFHLKMSSRQRREVISLLSLGFFITIIGCVRTYFLYMSVVSYDPSWWALPHWVASDVEVNTALICACVPVLRPMIGRLVTRGPAAAKRPALNESGRPRGDANRRARSLFSRKPSRTSDHTMANNSGSGGSTVFFKSIDVEGIANDGFGYTISITGPALSSRPRKRWRPKWNPRRNKEIDETSGPEMSGVRVLAAPRKSIQALKRNDVSRAGRDSRDLEKEFEWVEPGIEVVTRRSFEIRESFHEPDSRGWDTRNPYRHTSREPYEEDIEIGIERSAARMTDWSLLNDEKQDMGLAHVPEDSEAMQQQASTAPQRFNSNSSTQQPRRILSKDGLSSQGNSIPSHPPSIFSNRAASPPIRRAPSPIIRRSPSPIVQPLNSSQPWASMPQRPWTPSTSHSKRTETAIPKPDESWSGALETVYSPSLKEYGGALSYRSSIAVKDGSREGSKESLVIGEDSQNPVHDDEDDDHDPGSPTSIKLPIEGYYVEK